MGHPGFSFRFLFIVGVMPYLLSFAALKSEEGTDESRQPGHSLSVLLKKLESESYVERVKARDAILALDPAPSEAIRALMKSESAQIRNEARVLLSLFEKRAAIKALKLNKEGLAALRKLARAIKELQEGTYKRDPGLKRTGPNWPGESSLFDELVACCKVLETRKCKSVFKFRLGSDQGCALIVKGPKGGSAQAVYVRRLDLKNPGSAHYSWGDSEQGETYAFGSVGTRGVMSEDMSKLEENHVSLIKNDQDEVGRSWDELTEFVDISQILKDTQE